MKDKCVLIVDEHLPLGVIANTTAILAATVGKLRADMVGPDLPDSAGFMRQGITTMALPVLKGNRSLLKLMRNRLKEFEPGLLVVDLLSATRSTRSYEEYAAVMAQSPDEDIEYFGLALYGDKKLVNSLTGSLGLLR